MGAVIFVVVELTDSRKMSSTTLLENRMKKIVIEIENKREGEREEITTNIGRKK
jgi:hypothetical protein